MATTRDTAYPRFDSLTGYDLDNLYTPTSEDIEFSRRASGVSGQACVLVLLKSFQKLGHFPPFEDIPHVIIEHILKISGCGQLSKIDIKNYVNSGAKSRHMKAILKYLEVEPFIKNGKSIVTKAMNAAIETKDDLVDLINTALEEIVRAKTEIPSFHFLFNCAQACRLQWNKEFLKKIFSSLTGEQKKAINSLFEIKHSEIKSEWDKLKEDAGNPSITHLKELLEKLKRLKILIPNFKMLNSAPICKIERFAAMARVTGAYDMKRFKEDKRCTLFVCLVHQLKAQTLDDLGEMIVKKMRSIHNDADEYLTKWRIKHQSKTDDLILKLENITEIITAPPSQKMIIPKIKKVLGKKPEEILSDCKAYSSFIDNNYFSFMKPKLASHRRTLFSILDEVILTPTSADQRLLSAIKFIKDNRDVKESKLPTYKLNKGKVKQVVNLDWIPAKWWKTLTGSTKRDRIAAKIDKHHFEVCVFSHLADELQSGDMAIEGSKGFSDYREELITSEELKKELNNYSKIVDLPLSNAKSFIKMLKEKLDTTADRVDVNLPTNDGIKIKEDGDLSILRGPKRVESKWINNLERTIIKKLPPVGILDILIDTEKWMNWTKYFKPLSNRKKRMTDASTKYLATTFCYGCNLGPVQTEKCLKIVDRKQISWIDQQHITEETIEDAINLVINKYNQFDLPKFWGKGKSVSADGTKWEMRIRNLLSEYHIRYGGYGGIGYYHVADNYIALFSRFIPCGVWEAVHILDGLMDNKSDIRPDTIHGDTQAQNVVVFAFSYLLGINLVPRIRNWKDLKLYKSSSKNKYQNIEKLFTKESIDWSLIEDNLDDMLRVILSIKAGKIAPSTILKKLGNRSKKNKSYFAFRELGRVIRTIFLLNWVDDKEIRTQTQVATNKSESFNNFAQWGFFGGGSIIKNNDRDQQRKIIKYNHLVVNLVTFHTVQSLTNTIRGCMSKPPEVYNRNALSCFIVPL